MDNSEARPWATSAPSPMPLRDPLPGSPPALKVCGWTQPKNVAEHAHLPIDYWGIIAVPGTPRSVEIHNAKSLMDESPKGARWIGVFQNPSAETLSVWIETLPLFAIQLHGQEPVALAQSLPLPVIKVFRYPLSPEEQPLFKAYTQGPPENLLAILWDLPKGEQTKPFLRALSAMDAAHLAALPVAQWWAGSFNPENVDLKLSALHDGSFPCTTIDVASGVESSPGVKDLQRVETLLQKAHSLYSPPSS